jgi:hypothetical protein
VRDRTGAQSPPRQAVLGPDRPHDAGAGGAEDQDAIGKAGQVMDRLVRNHIEREVSKAEVNRATKVELPTQHLRELLDYLWEVEDQPEDVPKQYRKKNTKV